MKKLVKVSLRNTVFKFGGIFAMLAMVVTTSAANTACMWFMHQEEMPPEAKKLRKF